MEKSFSLPIEMLYKITKQQEQQLSMYTVKTRIKEPPFFGVRLAKVLKLWSLNKALCQNCRQGEG